MKEKQKSRLFYGYIVAAAGFWVWFIGFGIYGTFSVFFVPVSTDFGWTRADTALASSLGGLMMGALALIMGWLTDRLGPRFVVTFFGSFFGIAFLLLSRTTEWWQFILSHALISAIGISTASVPIMATISRWFIKKRGLISGLVQSGVGVGGFIICPLTGWLITGYGWRTAYAVLGLIGLAGVVVSGLFLRRDPSDMDLQPDGTGDGIAIPTKTLVACQTRNFRGCILKPSKSSHTGETFSAIPPARISLITRLMDHHVIDLLFLKSTLNRAKAARTSPPSKPKYMGLKNSSPNSERLSQKTTISRPRKTAKMTITARIRSNQWMERI